MPYQFSLRGIPVTCDTLEELLEAVHAGLADARSPQEVHATLGASSSAPTGIEPASQGKKRPGKPQGSGPKKAWAEAQAYADEHGVTIGEARSIIARKKKDAIAQAMGKVTEKTVAKPSKK